MSIVLDEIEPRVGFTSGHGQGYVQNMQPEIFIMPLENSQACVRRAEALAGELGLPLAQGALAEKRGYLLVRKDCLGLGLGKENIQSRQVFWPSLNDLDVSSKAGRSSRQPLLKAIFGRRGRSIPPLVLDATAGLGRDAWILAAHGARVRALERSGPVFALLRDSLARAGIQSPATARRIVPLYCEALDFLQSQGRDKRPDVVYLDPLFSQQKRKTAPWKGMQILQDLLAGEELQQEKLLQAALELASKRVVFKRPARSKPIEVQGSRPSLQIKSKALRFDIYLT